MLPSHAWTRVRNRFALALDLAPLDEVDAAADSVHRPVGPAVAAFGEHQLSRSHASGGRNSGIAVK
jgi:hypothetical protein